jgi:hypothetical protein
VEGKTGTHRSPIFSAVLLISLGLNAYFIWAYHYDVPDRNFVPHELHDAYFIKRHVGGKVFEIEHAGHLYTVKCEDTLSWLDGIYAPGRPMNDGCTYIPSIVGKSIASGLMRKEGGALVFQPWEDSDTVQTADVLTIVNDEKR